MPRIRTSRTKPPPEGFEDIQDVLEDYEKKMRDAESESHEGKRKVESVWPIMRLSHARSRYIYDLYYKRELISRELYDWLIKQKYADADEVEEERLREALVPKASLKKGTVVECPHCGCRGCASTD
ncbi:hypothetical protein EHS25_002014 [Saitozyma podzolica]|uniref:Component of the SF3b subcomplex of the U2 snRNP n=1 Tax=Saitozyma podzolica TaxID=1890683 RepID=A0A427YE80_9TREE|nr:hypothetical protein EHS25_002014 [Saitozyma podzolica]